MRGQLSVGGANRPWFPARVRSLHSGSHLGPRVGLCCMDPTCCGFNNMSPTRWGRKNPFMQQSPRVVWGEVSNLHPADTNKPLITRTQRNAVVVSNMDNPQGSGVAEQGRRSHGIGGCWTSEADEPPNGDSAVRSRSVRAAASMVKSEVATYAARPGARGVFPRAPRPLYKGDRRASASTTSGARRDALIADEERGAPSTPRHPMWCAISADRRFP
jgi:hypothetical protein